MNKSNAERILEETGGDCYYADVFIDAAIEAADFGIEVKVIDLFYDEVEKHRLKRKKRMMNYE